MPSSGSTRLPVCESQRCWCVRSCCGWAPVLVLSSPCPPRPVLSAAHGHHSAPQALARDTPATSASWPQSSCQMASTCSAQPHHLPQTQAPRSCHHWSTGTPLGTEAPPQPGLKCWLSVEVMAMRTSDSAVGAAAAVRLWAETTAQTTSSCGGCDPVCCGPGLARPPALSLLASS